mmetsp:Transcript_111062/g.220930  ORF Transcript_111062/g.220930 Transcript_111062/m.220930 type:complete len:221 (-) Transcript_111062:51-713(-)
MAVPAPGLSKVPANDAINGRHGRIHGSALQPGPSPSAGSGRWGRPTAVQQVTSGREGAAAVPLNEKEQEDVFLRGATSTSIPEDDAYDEALQEDVFLGRMKIDRDCVKNTFIHFDVDNFGSSRCGSGNQEPEKGITPYFQPQAAWATSPPVVLEKSFHTKYPGMETAHVRGECKPCAYYMYKQDGCRQGDSCEFCHLCTRGEIKRRKKAKAKALKMQFQV